MFNVKLLKKIAPRYYQQNHKQTHEDLLYLILTISGLIIFIGGGVSTVIALLILPLKYIAVSIIVMMIGILMMGMAVLVSSILKDVTKTKNVQKQKSLDDIEVTGRMNADLIEMARTICEKLGPEFDHPVKMDIYEKDYRQPGTGLFSPPSTITIYEEVDPSKEQELPDPMAPRYTQLATKKKKRSAARGWSAARRRVIMIFQLIGMLVAMPVGLILAYVIHLNIPIIVDTLTWSSLVSYGTMSWCFFFAYLIKKPEKEQPTIERRMLCAFREGDPLPVLIIEDVRTKVEKPIREVFNNITVTYEKRLTGGEELTFFRNQQRSLDQIVNEDGM